MLNSKLKKVIFHITAVLLVLMVLIPLFWTLRLSLSSTFSASVPIIPDKLTIGNYLSLFTNTPFPRWLLNTIIFAGSVTILNILFAVPAGYVLARERLPGSKVILFGIVSAWVIPWTTMLIPLYMAMAEVGLVDTYAGLIMPLAVNPIAVFLARQYILNIPEELEEVARIDGCGRLEIFFRIILPLAKPAIFIVGLMTFMFTWGNFILPLVMILSSSKQVLTTGIPLLQHQGAVNWGVRSAASIFGVLPMIVLFLVFNRYFMEGLALRTGTEQK